MDLLILPKINAILNSLSFIFLLIGFFYIKKGNKVLHKKFMVLALITSFIFLISYITYHYNVGHTEFSKDFPIARKVYLFILLPHILLAIINVPFIILLVIFAIKGKFNLHKKVAMFTYPSWLFVSVTGVVIYFMNYVWFVSPIKENEKVRPNSLQSLNKPSNQLIKKDTIEKEKQVKGLLFTPVWQKFNVDPSVSSLEVKFLVKNNGNEDITITKLDTDCECLSLSIDNKIVSSNSTSTITGIFDMKDIRGSDTRKIEVRTDQSASITLLVDIFVNPIYKLDKKSVKWNKEDQLTSKRVKFKVLRDKSIKIISAKSTSDNINIDIVTIKEGKEYDIKLIPNKISKTDFSLIKVITDCEIDHLARPIFTAIVER